MKTPRQILLDRHRAIEEKLDHIRCQAVASGLPSNSAGPVARVLNRVVPVLPRVWLELFWRPRYIWAGFAAVWVGIVVLNLSAWDEATRVTTRRTPSSSPSMILTWDQQEKLVTELMGQLPAPEADQPKPAKPGPRSERPFCWKSA